MKKLFRWTKTSISDIGEVDDKDKRRLLLWRHNLARIFITFFGVGFCLISSIPITTFFNKSNIYFVLLSNLQTVMAFLILILVPMIVINMAIVDILSHKIKKRKLDNGNKND